MPYLPYFTTRFNISISPTFFLATARAIVSVSCSNFHSSAAVLRPIRWLGSDRNPPCVRAAIKHTHTHCGSERRTTGPRIPAINGLVPSDEATYTREIPFLLRDRPQAPAASPASPFFYTPNQPASARWHALTRSTAKGSRTLDADNLGTHPRFRRFSLAIVDTDCGARMHPSSRRSTAPSWQPLFSATF